MKKKNLQLNKKLQISKKTIAALNASEMNAVQGGMANSIIKYGCPYSYECRQGSWVTDGCDSGLAQQCG
jgi:hypothetical protein